MPALAFSFFPRLALLPELVLLLQQKGWRQKRSTEKRGGAQLVAVAGICLS